MDVFKGKIARDLAALEEQLDRVVERAFGSGLRLPGRVDRFRPPIDVYEADEAIVVQVELGGVRADDVRIVVDGEYLQIKGRRSALHEDAPRRHLQMEIPLGQFERVLHLRAPYDPDAVTASLDNGILSVRLPRRATAARHVPVKST